MSVGSSQTVLTFSSRELRQLKKRKFLQLRAYSLTVEGLVVARVFWQEIRRWSLSQTQSIP
jgi:hypothetical protein